MRIAIAAWSFRAERWHRPAMLGLAAVILAVLAWEVAHLGGWVAQATALTPWGDHTYLREVALGWVSGDPLYPTRQLAGPYQLGGLDVLYPPAAMALLLPALLLPPALWLAIPLGVVAGITVLWRPSPIAWAAIAVCSLAPGTIIEVHQANPVLWVTAAIAVGTRWRPAFAFVLVKPSLLIFALPGIRSRGWWHACALAGAASLAFWPLTIEWLVSVLNARGPRSGLLYSLLDVPLLAIPLIAWAGAERPSRAPP